MSDLSAGHSISVLRTPRVDLAGSTVEPFRMVVVSRGSLRGLFAGARNSRTPQRGEVVTC